MIAYRAPDRTTGRNRFAQSRYRQDRPARSTHSEPEAKLNSGLLSQRECAFAPSTEEPVSANQFSGKAVATRRQIYS